MKKIFYFLFAVVLCGGLVCCEKNNGEEESVKYDDYENSKILFNTSWRLKYYNYRGEVRYPKEHLVFTFSDRGEIFSDGSAVFELYIGNQRTSGWSVRGDNYLCLEHNRYGDITSERVGQLYFEVGINGYIKKLSDYEMVTEVNDGSCKYYYEAVDNSGGGNNGGSSNYEKPDIGFYDFTATKSSLKIQYKIYNKDKAGVSNAKIYYGTTSNTSSSKSATISGAMITANISGLKEGTTYYVKCVATGKAGTTTTSVTKVVTNY